MNYKKVSTILACGALAAALTLGGCGKINADATLATVDGETISLGYGNFVARMTQYNYDSFLGTYYGEGYWTSDTYADDDGVNMQDQIKADVLEDLETEYLLAAHMEEYGVEISDEDQASIKEYAARFMDDNDKDAISELGASLDYVESYLYYTMVESKMTDAIRAACDVEITDEEAAQRTFSYVKIDTDSYTDDDGNTVEYTEDEVEELKNTAQALAEIARGGDLETAADTYGYSVSTKSYGSDEASEEDGGFCDAVIAAADAMSEGDVSDVIEGTDALYVIRLDSEYDEEATESKRASLLSDAQDAYYTEVVDGYMEAAEITVDEKQWAKVSFENMFVTADTDEE